MRQDAPIDVTDATGVRGGALTAHGGQLFQRLDQLVASFYYDPLMKLIATPRAAEEVAAKIMREMGFYDAKATPIGPDKGIDVVSKHAVAQVKWRTLQISRPDLQRLYGARGHSHKKEMLFFSQSTYSKQCIEYAGDCGIALFILNPDGTVAGVNNKARQLMKGRLTVYTDAIKKQGSRTELTDKEREKYSELASVICRAQPPIEMYKDGLSKVVVRTDLGTYEWAKKYQLWMYVNSRGVKGSQTTHENSEGKRRSSIRTPEGTFLFQGFVPDPAVVFKHFQGKGQPLPYKIKEQAGNRTVLD